MSTRRRFRLLAAVTAAALVASACAGDGEDTEPEAVAEDVDESSSQPTEGDGEGEPSEGQDTEGGAQAEPGEAAAEPDPDGVLRWLYNSSASNNYDPHMGANLYLPSLLYPVYDSLVGMTPEGELVPELATNWEYADDDLSLTLDLRDDVVFHDGASFDAHVAVANFDRIRSADASPIGGWLRNVDSITATDDYTLEFQLSQPDGALLYMLADKLGMMVSPDALDNEDLDVNPVGAGPFVVTELEAGVSITYERFEDYYDPERQRLQAIDLQMVTGGGEERVRMMRAGEGDGTMLFGDLAGQFEEHEGTRVEITPAASVFQLYVNTERVEPMQDVDVRRAVSMAIDRAAIAETFLGGYCTPSTQPWPEGHLGYNPDVDTQYYEYDPEAARALLEEAGYGDGFDFHVKTTQTAVYGEILQAIQAQLAEIGIDMGVELAAIGEAVSSWRTERTSDAYFSMYAGAAVPALVAEQEYYPDSPNNPGGLTLPGLVEAMDAGRAATDDDERAEHYQEMSAIASEGVFHFPICHQPAIRVLGDEVLDVGAMFSAMDDFTYYTVSE